MKRYLKIAATATQLAMATAPAYALQFDAPITSCTAEAGGDTINVHTLPSIKAPVVTQFKSGTRVFLSDHVGKWWFATNPSSTDSSGIEANSGWINDSLLKHCSKFEAAE